MDNVLRIFGTYLVAGILALGMLDLFTHRIRNQLQGATYETQEKLTVSGNITSHKTAMLLTVLALWLFWPVAIFGAAVTWVTGSKTRGEE